MRVRPHLIWVAIAMAVLSPFALSVAAHAFGNSTTSFAGDERSALAFREYLLNLGRIPESRSDAKGRFWFFNSSDRPLTILGFRPSCGCLTPLLDKKTYGPGEQGTFVVTADMAGEGSDGEDRVKQHFVDVDYDAGQGKQTTRVQVKFVLPARRVLIEPRTLLVYQFSSEPTTREITVTDRRTSPINITAVECSSDELVVEAMLAESAEEPSRATITVTIPGDLARSVRALVTIRTDDAEQPLLHVPIVVQVREPGSPTLGGVPLELVPRPSDTARR